MVETNRRCGRNARVIAAFQAAKGTIATNFTTASATTLWVENITVPIAHRKRLQSVAAGWMTEGLTEAVESEFSLPENPSGTILMNATPKSVEWALRSNWGPFAATTFTLKTQINEFLTLAWVEESLTSPTQNLIRIPDVWFHSVEFIFSETRGLLQIQAQYAGRGPIQVDALNALPGGVVLPASPMTPSDTEKFCLQEASVIREPLGANVDLQNIDATITLEQGLIHEWTMTDDWEVAKMGKTKSRLAMRANVSDESWAILNANRAGTTEHYRVSLASESGAPKTLTFDLFDTDFEIDALGRTGLDMVEFSGRGMAHAGSSGYVDITLA